MTYKYIIPMLPPSLNKFAGRQNVWEYRQLKQEWKQAICLFCRVRPKAPLEKAVVSIHYVFPDRIRRDPDNYSGKMILDGLTAAGVIKDDSFSCIELKLSAEVGKGGQTVITVEGTK